jgi:hypothetical protein
MNAEPCCVNCNFTRAEHEDGPDFVFAACSAFSAPTTGEWLLIDPPEPAPPTALQVEANAVRAACVAVAALPVSSQAEIDALGAGIKDIKARLKFLEASRKARTAPLVAQTDAIRDEYRPAEEAYAALEVATKARMARYNQETRAAEQAARSAALANQEAAHAAASAGDMPAAIALQQTAFQAMTATPDALKTHGIGSRFEWRIEVTAPELVPRALCVPNEAAILADVRANLPKAESGKVPGLAGEAWAAAGVRVFLHEIIVAR